MACAVRERRMVNPAPADIPLGLRVWDLFALAVVLVWVWGFTRCWGLKVWSRARWLKFRA